MTSSSSNSSNKVGGGQSRGCSPPSAFLAALIVIAVSLIFSPVAAAATSPVRAAKIGPFAVAPEPTGSGQARPFFRYTQLPGSSVHDRVVISNLGDIPLTFDLYSADAYNTSTGSFQVKPDTARKDGVGAWVQLPVKSVTVAPHTRDLVPFTLAVPSDATPGDHAGGIVALLRPVFPPKPGTSQTLTRQGIGARIYLRVPGALAPGLAVTSVTSKDPYGPLGGGKGSISATIADTGNTMLDATISIRVIDEFGRTVATLPKTTLAALLPGNTVRVSKPWPHLPRLGRFHIDVAVTGTGAKASGAEVIWILPWLTLVLIAAIFVGLIGTVSWWRRRRRDRRVPARPAAPPIVRTRETPASAQSAAGGPGPT